jgi:predicted nucleotidyltransferase
MATAAKPLRKSTAEQLLAEIIGRARLINADTKLAFRVQQLVLFGSVMKGANRPNDVDIGCTLVPRFKGERQRLLEDQRRAEKGRFANTSEWAISDLLISPR